MARKVQGRVGISLSDLYDVKGGQLPPVEDVLTSTPQAVHEFAATAFSERLNGRIRRISTGAIAQSTAFDDVATLQQFTDVPTRVISIFAFSTNDRLDFATVSVGSTDEGGGGREIPIWNFDTLSDVSAQTRISDNGAAAANVTSYLGGWMLLPSMVLGNDQPGINISSIRVRGQSTGFGAGTETFVFLIYYASSEVADQISSYGLPVPSW